MKKLILLFILIILFISNVRCRNFINKKSSSIGLKRINSFGFKSQRQCLCASLIIPTISPTPSPTISPTPSPSISPTPSPTISPTPSPPSGLLLSVESNNCTLIGNVNRITLNLTLCNNGNEELANVRDVIMVTDLSESISNSSFITPGWSCLIESNRIRCNSSGNYQLPVDGCISLVETLESFANESLIIYSSQAIVSNTSSNQVLDNSTCSDSPTSFYNNILTAFKDDSNSQLQQRIIPFHKKSSYETKKRISSRIQKYQHNRDSVKSIENFVHFSNVDSMIVSQGYGTYVLSIFVCNDGDIELGIPITTSLVSFNNNSLIMNDANCFDTNNCNQLGPDITIDPVKWNCDLSLGIDSYCRKLSPIPANTCSEFKIAFNYTCLTNDCNVTSQGVSYVGEGPLSDIRLNSTDSYFTLEVKKSALIEADSPKISYTQTLLPLLYNNSALLYTVVISVGVVTLIVVATVVIKLVYLSKKYRISTSNEYHNYKFSRNK